MTDRSSIDHLEDILDAAEKAQAFAEGTTYESFVDDDKSVFAVIRALEVVGEATAPTAPRRVPAGPMVLDGRHAR